MSNQLLKKVLYRLKRSYGCPLAVYKILSRENNLQTGQSSENKIVADLKQVIVLPSKIHRDTSYNAAFTKANGNFTYGAVFSDDIKQIIIDNADLPKGFGISASDDYYVVYGGNRWTVKVVEKLDYELGYLITLERSGNAIAEQIISRTIRERFLFHQIVDTQDAQSYIDKLTFSETVIVQAIKVHHQNVIQTLTFLEDVEERR